MRRFLSLFVMLMLCGFLAFAQNRVVTGKIVDDKGNGVPFASIKVENSNVGTSTESDGSFSIRASNNTVLVVSSSGFESQKITVGSQNFIGASLTATSVNMQEVIVTTALGQQRQKSSLGFSTATIKSTELTAAKAVNIAQGLTGKISGASFNQTNSGVFQDTRITLRGIRSLTGNNQPMLILDGVPISLGFLNSINPNDIASVDILKSAGSTAIYGPDGVNGAIVITTKRGSKAKPQISFSHSTQFESINYMPQFQTGWGAGYNQDAAGNGEYEPHEQQSWGDAFDGSTRPFGDPGPNGIAALNHTYSNLAGERKRFWDVGITNQTDVSYSTGDFYISGQNVSIKGTVPGDENTRRTVTFRSEKEYNKFKAIFNARYTQGKYDVTSSNTLIYYGVTSAPGSIPLSKLGNWRNDWYASPNGYYTLYLSNQEYSPYFTKDINRQFGKSDDIFGSTEFQYKANSWLNFVYRVGLAVSNTVSSATKEAFTFSDYYRSRPDASAATAGTTAGISEGTSYSNRLTSEFFANFNKNFGKVGVSATLGHSFRESRNNVLSVGSSNLGKTQFLSIVNRLGEATPGVDKTLTRLERYFGRVGFDYNKWLFLEGTFSYDRDSRLAPANGIFDWDKVGLFYPGASTSILLHEIIPGLKDNKTLNFVKVRGAIAKTGNVNMSAYSNEAYFNAGTFFPYGALQGFQSAGTIYQTGGLRPEYVNTKEVGLELGFLKNKIILEGTYYNQNNTDQIMSVQLSNATGSTSALVNTGSFTNKGLELDLKINDLIKIGNVGIDAKINYTNQSSKITKLSEGVNELGIGNYNYAIVGAPAFVFKLTDYVRDDQGRVIVSNTTGMPTLNSNLTQFGQTLPEHILGLNLNLNWKNFTFGVVAEYRAGNQIVADQLGQFLDDNGVSKRSGDYNRRAFVFPNSVVEDGTGKYVPNTNVFTQNYGRLFYNDDINTDVITNYLADGAFWKLREVALSYAFPAELFKGNGIKGVTIGVSGRNLFMWLPKSNQWTDPEFSANGNSSYTGNAGGRSTAFNMPPTRIIGANITVQF